MWPLSSRGNALGPGPLKNNFFLRLAAEGGYLSKISLINAVIYTSFPSFGVKTITQIKFQHTLYFLRKKKL